MLRTQPAVVHTICSLSHLRRLLVVDIGEVFLRSLPSFARIGSLEDLTLVFIRNPTFVYLSSIFAALPPFARLHTLRIKSCKFRGEQSGAAIDSHLLPLPSIRSFHLVHSSLDLLDVIPHFPNLSSINIYGPQKYQSYAIKSPWPASIREISYDPWLQLLVTGSKADYARPVSRLDLEGTIMVAPLTMDIRAPRRYEPLGNIDHIRPLSISMHVNADSETEDHPRNASPFWKELGMQVSPPLRALRLQISPRLLGDVATEDQLQLLLLVAQPTIPCSILLEMLH